MLKVDFSNAFNMVDRTEMLAQVYEKLPGLYRWVEYCYSHPAHLFFGSCVLQSAAGYNKAIHLALCFSRLCFIRSRSRFRLTFLIWTCASGTWTMAPSLAAWTMCTKCLSSFKETVLLAACT